MAERSFKEEVKKLKLGEGEVFHGEGILAVTKALLESGVSYVAGYQGAPISHLMDVLSDAQDILSEQGIRFESSASEATAAATLAASVNYPLRGAVTFKATVGTNVASDALANLSSGGVLGGALIIVGEDYGDGSSIMQERSHAFAMKSQMWLLDPRPNLPSMVRAVKMGFELSEASNTPVMMQLRIRACHVHGRFNTSQNLKPRFSLKQAQESPQRDVSRIVLPPSSFLHEQEKIRSRWPKAVEFIEQHELNEFFGLGTNSLGLIVQGGMYNTVVRALQRLGLSDVYGQSQLPLYVMNVAYPVVPNEVLKFCKGLQAVLMIEEGQPNYVEQNLAMILRHEGVPAVLHGKDFLPMAGEYVSSVVEKGLADFLRHYGALPEPAKLVEPSSLSGHTVGAASQAQQAEVIQAIAPHVHARPPGFCTGCPERPIFTAMKLMEKDLGSHHISADIGCHLFSILPPFNLGNTTMGYGLGAAGSSAFNDSGSKKAIAIMGDGGFWHNGLTSGVANAVFNKSPNLTIIVDNSYTSATGGQDVLSSKANNPNRSTGHAIEQAVKGVGVKWVKMVRRTYDIAGMRDAMKAALSSEMEGPKVIIAQSECMLNKQRREKPLARQAAARGERVVREKFGVDEDTCTGDHSCIRLSGCPSLSIKDNPDPLRREPVATVLDSCVGCGVCGEAAHAAVLCPSFYDAKIISNPGFWERIRAHLSSAIIAWVQDRMEVRSMRWRF